MTRSEYLAMLIVFSSILSKAFKMILLLGPSDPATAPTVEDDKMYESKTNHR